MNETTALIVECMLVPLGMYLILFWLRDRLSILHMPVADLVALVVVVDVALAIHYTAVDGLLQALDIPGTAPASPGIWWKLAIGSATLCIPLVLGIEKNIRRIVVHHLSIGKSHMSVSKYLPPGRALCERNVWRFNALWSLGFALVTVVVSLHADAVNIRLLELAGLASPASPHALLVDLLGPALMSFAGFLVLSVVLILTGVLCYSKEPLKWTYLPEDQWRGP